MGMVRSASALACVVAAIALLPGCGGGDDAEIPRDDAQRMLETLGELESAAEEGNCTGATSNVIQLRTQAEQTQVGESLHGELMEGVARTEELVKTQVCTDTGATGTQSDAGEQRPEDDAATTTPTTTAPDETTTTETEPPPPSDEDTGDGGESDEESGGGDGAEAFDPGGGNPPPGPGGNPNAPPSGGIESDGSEDE